MWTVKVTVEAVGELKARFPRPGTLVEAQPSASVEDVLAECGVSHLPVFAVVNGKAVPRTYRLSDGDRLVIAPVVGGG